MPRIAAVFVAVCVILIAGSLGVVTYLVFGFSVADSAIISLAALIALTLYNMLSTRIRDRAVIGDQIADLSRSSADLARQVAELNRRVTVVEKDARAAAGRAKAVADPLAAEIGELGGLIKQLAETVASHETLLAAGGGERAQTPRVTAMSEPEPQEETQDEGVAGSGPFKGKSREDMLAEIRAAIDSGRVDLYLQPILTLPQRKVRYYEGMTRLRTGDGELMLPADFIALAESEGLMPSIDNLLLFRCVQVLRRLLTKNRDIGLFCNVSMTTLHNPESFRRFFQFMDANRVLAPALTLEFSQLALNALGPMEQESLAALAEIGFRFSMDQVTDLRMEPRTLADRGVRFVKIPASLLLNRAAAPADIHAADLSDLLGRHGISLIAEKIETEAVVVDLLDYDVRFGQGFLFSPPRPVRAEALQGVADRNDGGREADAPVGGEEAAPQIHVA